MRWWQRLFAVRRSKTANHNEEDEELQRLQRLEDSWWSKGEESLPKLWQTLERSQTSPRIKLRTAALLLRFGGEENRPKVRGMLLDALMTGNEEIRTYVTGLLTGDTSKWTDEVCLCAVRDYASRLIRSDSEEDRSWATYAFTRSWPRDLRGHPGIEALLFQLLHSDSVKDRRAAAEALTRNCPRDLQAIPGIEGEMFDALGDGDQCVRDNAAIVLNDLGVSPTGAHVAACVEAVNRAGTERATFCLVKLMERAGSEGTPAIESLARIAAHGKAGKDIVQQVEEAVRTTGGSSGTLLIGFETSLVKVACDALVQIGDASVEALTGLLSAPNPSARRCAADSLGKLGASAAAAERELVKLLEDSDWSVKLAAAGTLAKLGPLAADQIVAALIPGLQHPNWPIRGRSAVVLGLCGQAAIPALPALRHIMTDPDASVAKVVRDALTKIQA
ncbi:MAG: HEAT repeat domain-containing protein [bacterium]